MSTTLDSFGSRAELRVGDTSYQLHRLDALERAGAGKVDRMPWSLKILLENLLRREDGRSVTADDIRSLASWTPGESSEREIAFMPARVLLQDFTGVPTVVDLAAMRDAMRSLGGDPKRITPLQPADLVIDQHGSGHRTDTREWVARTGGVGMGRNKGRYARRRWAHGAFDDFRVVPPETGIVHQINLEYLASVVGSRTNDGVLEAFPDTLVGTDSHTTMINGLGVLGWGVGGIEAEAAMLGQPISMLIPDVVGFRLTGRLAEGATATDLVLTGTGARMAREVVVEHAGLDASGLSWQALAKRATRANM